MYFSGIVVRLFTEYQIGLKIEIEIEIEIEPHHSGEQIGTVEDRLGTCFH